MLRATRSTACDGRRRGRGHPRSKAPGGRSRHRRGQELRVSGAGDSGRRRSLRPLQRQPAIEHGRDRSANHPSGQGAKPPSDSNTGRKPIAAARFQPATDNEDGDDKRYPRRIVVSTHTISLQEQLIGKDLPLLERVIPLEFSAVLVKGRGNYLSLRRLDNAAAARRQPVLASDEEFEQLRQLAGWSKETADGSLADLDFRPLPQVWDEVASDHGNCMGRQVPDLRRVLLLPGPAADAERPDPGRQPRPVLHRPGAAAAGREHPAGLRRGDLRRGPHARSRGRRPPGPERHQRARSSTCSTSSTTTAPTAGCWCITSWATPSSRCGECRDRADDFFDDVRRLAATSTPGGNGRVRRAGDRATTPLSEALVEAGRAWSAQRGDADRQSAKSGRTSRRPPTGWRRWPTASTTGWRQRAAEGASTGSTSARGRRGRRD